VSIGKALGAGFPVGAALVSQEVADTIAFGDHGTTYGGNLLACRAALCVLDALTSGLMLQVRRVGHHFEEQLRSIAARHAIVKEVRGAGLMWGLQLTRDATAVVPAALERGLVVNRTAETVVRLLPPLIITEAEVDEALGRLDAALAAVGAES
jgi:acetylornithine/N-succinyldiaminopimelate aminotransferase